MSYNLDLLQPYTDELSFDLISKAILQTNVMNYATIRSGLKFGTTTINLVSGDGITVADRACGWDAAGTLDYSQVTIDMQEKQTKQALCPTLIRDYYLADKLSASAYAEEVPFAEVISNLFVEKIKNWNESYLGATTLGAVTVALGAADSGQTVASNATTIIADVMDLIDAVPASVLDRTDLGVILAPAYYNMLRRALTAQDLYNFNSAGTDSNTELFMPGTDFKVIKSSGFAVSATYPTVTGASFVAGPLADLVIGVGLEDDFDTLKIFYSQDNDEVRVMGAWRLGLGVVDVTVWSRNGTL
tara:strand:- start:1987 stop:2892 length:906 start_codon:yes stop_codon:yes gene_type:complete